MSERDEFLRGFCDGSGLDAEAAVQTWVQWLSAERATEVERIDLESGGYEAGLEIGREWAREANN